WWNGRFPSGDTEVAFPTPSPANSDDPLYQLRVQKKEAKRMRNEFIRNDDDEGLARWNRQQHAAWDIQRREGELLLKYLYSAGSFPSSELRYLKTERQEKIHQRLKDLGWDEKYLNFWGRSGRTIKKWRSLVEVPAPLTGQTWVGILPELTKLLQVNRQRLDGIEWYQCLDRRRFKVEDLLRALQRDTDPYQPIINALQQLPPESMDSVKTRPVLRAPFPSIMTLVGWSCLVRLYIDENTLERVEGLFQERRDIISQKWLEWRTEREDQLIKQYKSSSAEGTGLSLNTMLTIKGSTEATKDLPANTRFLLRADTVLMKYIPVHFYTEIDREHGPSSSSVHFPFISGLHDYPYLWEVRWAYDPGEDERNIRGYVRYIGEEVIVKALLKELDMSDAAHIELEYMGKVFICGRCTCQETMGWDEIVDHYHANKRNWLEGRFIHNSFKTRHPVVFRNLHDLEPGASAKPLVRLGADTYTPFNPVAHCLICRWIEHFELCGFDSTERMGEHMVKMHDSAEPIEGLHFMSESRHCEVSIDKKVGMPDRLDWEKQWDEYHDARSAFKGETEARV
ncbi:hypothetical protein FRC11_014689, partial [Ceratobasidium sp. 423]